ncbi:sigma-54-dependent Fis family transcriptional regulator [Nocardia cyriacigeorgica]|uniref:sigma-54-dependent Fis family transcriptional regulator n=1 Tax=Nocardia cyriacigeorgica TaxID=135487 RepID=UPI001895A144|nr:helix-turn-helix domain-containing protein [Nocardia cyriacigeorgica]MBF6435763.1 Fis family transcriptional regulator [Nocardia cyriacigeorgica]MBF6454158.1 Fis family transcriptional regulator [Nocardia cyriacigeorgica]MBF6477610.1 Fis family transcriptional regulator [Nocardia cyriacigeorgica]MBF6552052.1 Fis family transcriptional regulator [Nocardia cyriacigeorgica]
MSQVETLGQGSPARGPRPDIALSWQRSRLCGVDPGAGLDSDPDAEVDSAGRLLHAARPILDELATQLSGTGLAVLLADGDGRIVSRVFDGGATARWFDRAGVVVGSLLGEDRAGTNALGTPLELKRPIVINGCEHYLERFKDMSCYGQPIIHPVTRRVEGVLDLSARGAEANPLFAPLVARAVADIEARLLAGRRAAQQRLIEAFQRAPAHRDVAVAAIGGDVVLANPAAMDLFDQADHHTLRELALDLRPGGQRRISLELSSGERAVVQADAIPGTDGGALFVVRSEARLPVPRTRTGAADRLRDRLRAVAAGEGAVMVAGEPGTGRSTVITELVAGAEAVRVDAADLPVRDAEAWLRAVCERERPPAFLAIDDVDRLAPEAVHAVAQLVRTTRSPRVVLSSGSGSAPTAELSALLAACPHRVHLAPLRERRADIAEIAAQMLAGIRPGLRLTARALGALRAGQWPGNLTELHSVLVQAASSARGDRIDLSDLPAPYRISPRVARLSERELAERRIIIAALADSDGNKVHAARRLGMSRTTLYARMRTLDIDR